MKNPFQLRRETENGGSKAEDTEEVVLQDQAEPKARAHFPPPDMGSGIATITANLFDDIDDYSYKIINGDVNVGDRFKFMLLTRAWHVLGLVSGHDVEAARWLDAKLREDERLNGRAFVRNVLIHLGAGISKSMWGKNVQGVSVTHGEGVEELRRGGTLEP